MCGVCECVCVCECVYVLVCVYVCEHVCLHVFYQQRLNSDLANASVLRLTCCDMCFRYDSTAGCSIWLATTCGRRPASPAAIMRWRAAMTAQYTAQLSASVPQDVKYTSLGWAPISDATCWREVSTAVLHCMSDQHAQVAWCCDGCVGVCVCRCACQCVCASVFVSVFVRVRRNGFCAVQLIFAGNQMSWACRLL